MNFEELCNRLEDIKEMGYVESHRYGPTGIGKTLEDLLGIEENNVPGPDAEEIELKSIRKGTDSLMTLFTKNPKPRGANTELRKEFGYEDDEGRGIILHTTACANEYNTLKGKKGFKVDVSEDKIELVGRKKNVWGHWNKEILKEVFERKLPALVYVKASTKNENETEYFWYDEAYYLEGFDFENFVELIEDQEIKIDTRIGRYSDGSVHDHGTAFRVFEDRLDLCFDEREPLM